ncbi:MAG TPA: undecaprenyl-diphosphate phosphatase [Nitrolancea sp.]|jgi:undecaprenyl-diphosphatase|nr:undecaprenyl-diphosphate phosphatase [Nitrolancea sp.]
MSWLEACVMAILQGATELFPISSLGHAVILPKLLHWHINENSDSFLPFLVVLHLGTALALLLYFWRDWVNLLGSVVGRGEVEQREPNRKLLALVVVATIPAGLIGLLLEKPLRSLFGAPLVAAVFLVVNGVVLLFGERKRRKAGFRAAADLTWAEAFIVGVCQSFALIPGMSRSGTTMVAGLSVGLRHDEAARFSFLMATPVIGAAGLLEVPKLIKNGSQSDLTMIIVAGLLAGLAAFLSVTFLMRYFKRSDVESLNPFGYYCIVAGIAAFVLIAAGI